MKFEIICLDGEAFYELLNKVYEYLRDKPNIAKEDKWISGVEAMHKLRITSKTTLQKMRDEGKIRYSQLEKKSFFMILIQSTLISNEMLMRHFDMS